MNLNEEPAIIGMANALDLDVVQPVEAIKQFCRDKVRRFLRRTSQLSNIEELQRLVCKRLNLTVHEIRGEEDIPRLAEYFRSEGEIAAAAAVATQLRPDTFGMLVQLFHRAKNGRAKFVTFIDCRGEKAARRVWTIWHEIAHCLTAKDQLALPLRRTTVETIEKDPVEKLTDIIAADFAFYEPLFRPVLDSEVGHRGRVTFRVAERVRDRFNPEASFASTLNACIAKAPAPIILLEAGLALKKGEQRLVQTGVASIADFQPSLRVLSSIPNEVARELLPHIHKQMRVPLDSVIARVHASDMATILTGGAADESLRNWTTSTGGGLPDVAVSIEARKFGDRVVAILTLAA